MNQEKLNLLHPISDISGSSASFFTISGVMYEGPEGVFYRRRSNSMIYCPHDMCSALLRIEPVMEANFRRKLCFFASSSDISCAVSRIIW